MKSPAFWVAILALISTGGTYPILKEENCREKDLCERGESEAFYFSLFIDKDRCFRIEKINQPKPFYKPSKYKLMDYQCAIERERCLADWKIRFVRVQRELCGSPSKNCIASMAMRLIVMLAAIRDFTVGEERVHFRIVVPEFINTMTHTKTIYVMPKKGKHLEDPGLASALEAAGIGTALGGTYGGSMGNSYGSPAGYVATGLGPTPTAPGYGISAFDGGGNVGGGYSFAHTSGQGGEPRPSVTNLGMSGNVLTSFGHNTVQHVSSGPSPTPPSLPVIVPLRAPPLPPPPPPGTIIVAAGHDASFAELLSHSNRVRNALRAQRYLRYNTVQPTGGQSATPTPVTQVTHSVHTPGLNQQASPTVPPELQPVYGYYGLSTGQRYQPITVYQSNSASQVSKGSKCHGGNLVGVNGAILVHDGQGIKHGNGHYHTVYSAPQVSAHGHAGFVNSQSNGHRYLGNGGSYYAGFATPQTLAVNHGQTLYNAYSSLPVPPAYSALNGNQNGDLNVRPTLMPVVTTSGQINNGGYSTTQVYPTVQFHTNAGGNYVYRGSHFRQPPHHRLPNTYETQSFSIKDARDTFSGSPQHYYSPTSPQQPTVSISPHGYHGQRNTRNKNGNKSPVVRCRKDDKNGLICIASANVLKNTENGTKVYVGDAWAKTKHLKSKDKGIQKINTKIRKKVTPPKTKQRKKKKGDYDDKSQLSASGESMSGSAEEQNVGDIPPASEENSTPQVDPANLEAGDFSASITTSSYGDEAPEEQQMSQEQAGGDFSGDQDSQQVGRTVPTDMDVEGDGDTMKKGFRLQSNQWIPINPARLEQDDSTQDQPGEKRDTNGGSGYSDGEYSPTPAPLKSSTVVLGVTRDYKPLQAFFGRQVQAETTPAPTQISNLKYGDMYWSMVRGKLAGTNEDTEHVNEEPASETEAAVKLSNGLGIDEHLSLVNGWGSHIDGTEDALARPEAFPPESKPADISSEVHLTTVIPDGIALYYQNEAEELANTQRHETKQDEEEAEENATEDEHSKEESHLSTTTPSVSTGRFRGKIKYSDHLTTIAPDVDGDLESRTISPSSEVHEEVVEGPLEDPVQEVTEETPEESQEDENDPEGPDTQEALSEELRKDIESTKEDLKSALDSRAKNSGPKIISETGHILRGLAVAEQLDVQRW